MIKKFYNYIKRQKADLGRMKRDIGRMKTDIDRMKPDVFGSKKKLRGIERNLFVIEHLVEEIYAANFDKRKYCPICNSSFISFRTVGVIPRLGECPTCLSRERHRAFWLTFKDDLDECNASGGKLLHFAAEQCLYNYISSLERIDYWPVDIAITQPFVRKRIDITDIDFPDDTFDLVICNHVMEHVEDDASAFRELKRVLKPRGRAIISVPLEPDRDVTFENKEYNTPALRLKHFGQGNHVRKYGMDIVDRMERAGLSVEIVKPNENRSQDEIDELGLDITDVFFIATKA